MRHRIALRAAVLALAVTACGDDDDAAPTTAAATTDGPATDGPATTTGAASTGAPAATATADVASTTTVAAFPRTVEHAMGTTAIPAPATRVVTLDMSFVDAALALDQLRHEALYDHLGMEGRAADVIADFEGRAAAVGAAMTRRPTIGWCRSSASRRWMRSGSISGPASSGSCSTTPGWRGRNQHSQDPARFMVEASCEQLVEADAGADRLVSTIFGNEDPADEQAAAGRELLEGNPLWSALPTVPAGTATEMSDETWMSAVGLFGAHAVVDDLAATFGVDPATEES